MIEHRSPIAGMTHVGVALGLGNTFAFSSYFPPRYRSMAGRMVSPRPSLHALHRDASFRWQAQSLPRAALNPSGRG
ncbi:hypothetical protein JQ633_03305 [Bradyrhizobium tropiciagri]|uniref:hypothetical protein n=1 Tax=Bradyrhizobium tropiciagri TaxID=312253 RepID=UPI001BA96DEB|nr:hypothetical protein [Bradyrhizobium tropiciagri]MBR0869371.1 hypothetical protein [Bradyrhizobium tropiciagri]